MTFISGRTARCSQCTGTAFRLDWERWDGHDDAQCFVGLETCEGCGAAFLFLRREVDPMVKKKRPAAKKSGKKKTSGKKPAARKFKGPRQAALPGTEQVRNLKLDELCESIGDGRDRMNKIRSEEKDDKRNALVIMHDEQRTAYRHAGVELVRVPGEEKLRVRKSEEDATIDASPDTDEPETIDGE